MCPLLLDLNHNSDGTVKEPSLQISVFSPAPTKACQRRQCLAISFFVRLIYLIILVLVMTSPPGFRSKNLWQSRKQNNLHWVVFLLPDITSKKNPAFYCLKNSASALTFNSTVKSDLHRHHFLLEQRVSFLNSLSRDFSFQCVPYC